MIGMIKKLGLEELMNGVNLETTSDNIENSNFAHGF